MSTLDLNCRLQRSGFCLDVALSLPLTGVTGVYGPSGCGKTTLLRIIAGLESSDSSVNFGDQVWQSPEQFLEPHKRSVGYVFQQPGLFSYLSVRGNLEYARKRAAGQSTDIAALSELLGISKLMERMPDTLSGGEQQRVAIARALASGPQILLMDEPLASLDAARKTEFLPYLQSLHDELSIPVIYVSHAIDEIARIADNLVVLHEGSVVAEGALSSVLSSANLFRSDVSLARTVIDAQVSGFEADDGLTILRFDGGELLVTMPQPDTECVRLQIAASDISLTLVEQSDTSILNILPAQVAAVDEVGSGRVLVTLLVGSSQLVAQVSSRSAQQLRLAEGLQVYAQIKGVAVLA